MEEMTCGGCLVFLLKEILTWDSTWPTVCFLVQSSGLQNQQNTNIQADAKVGSVTQQFCKVSSKVPNPQDWKWRFSYCKLACGRSVFINHSRWLQWNLGQDTLAVLNIAMWPITIEVNFKDMHWGKIVILLNSLPGFFVRNNDLLKTYNKQVLFMHQVCSSHIKGI